MNTRDLTRGAMVCGLYGLLLFLNQQTGLGIESSMNWIFAFPILIFTGMYGSSVGSLVAISMALMTFLFGGFTTWFYSWTAILIGYIYGMGLKRQWKHSSNFALCAVLSILTTALIIYVWAGLFGYDLASDFAQILAFLPSIHLRVLIFLFVVLLGVLQAFCIHMIALMVCVRMRLDIRPLGSIRDFRSPRWVGVVSLIIFVVYGALTQFFSLDNNGKDLLQIIFVLDMMVLDFFGVIYFLHRSISRSSRLSSFLAITGSFVPFLQIVWIVAGLLDCLLQLRHRGNER